MAYTADLDHALALVDGEPRSYVLRATHVYSREGDECKVADRQGTPKPGSQTFN